MKRLFLIPALLLGTVAMATEYNYEVTPVVGYNFTENNTDIKDYAAVGAELQYNGFDFPIKPELSLIYSKADFETTPVLAGTAMSGIVYGGSTKIWRTMLNGVYEFDKLGPIIPLAKAGVGYEHMDNPNRFKTGNSDSGFVDAGVGAKVPFTEAIALKVEAIYMAKHNHSRWDSNLLVTAGLNFAFGAVPQPEAPVVEEIVVVEEEIIVVAPPPPAPVEIIEEVVVIVDGDDDKDGVLNSVDKCPNTSANVRTVDIDGCAALVSLEVLFKFDSFDVRSSNDQQIQNFTSFMKEHSGYNATIVGYTDSTGPEAYNEVLSQHRADAVKKIIVSEGIEGSRISAVGRGESNPIATNTTKDGRAQNRRIEAELVKN